MLFRSCFEISNEIIHAKCLKQRPRHRAGGPHGRCAHLGTCPQVSCGPGQQLPVLMLPIVPQPRTTHTPSSSSSSLSIPPFSLLRPPHLPSSILVIFSPSLPLHSSSPLSLLLPPLPSCSPSSSLHPATPFSAFPGAAVPAAPSPAAPPQLPCGPPCAAALQQRQQPQRPLLPATPPDPTPPP